MQAKVDVIIPTHNLVQYLGECLDSVLSQSEVLGEVFVIDDGSTDNTAEMIKLKYGKQQRIHYIYQQNRGPSAARNLGISYSKAPYVALIDADDYWHPDKLHLQLEQLLSEGKKTGVIFSDYYEVSPANQILRNETNYHRTPQTSQIKQALLCGNVVLGSCSSVLIRRQLLKQVGGFDPKLRIGEDWDLWLRLSKVTNFSFLDRKLVYIRQRADSHQRQLALTILDYLYLYHKHRTHYDELSEMSLVDVRHNIVRHFLERPFDFANNRRILTAATQLQSQLWPNISVIVQAIIWVVYAKANQLLRGILK